jgi:hypothetical protein
MYKKTLYNFRGKYKHFFHFLRIYIFTKTMFIMISFKKQHHMGYNEYIFFEKNQVNVVI